MNICLLLLGLTGGSEKVPIRWVEDLEIVAPHLKLVGLNVWCLCFRAEEEDEHLERTLEQNKGKMAKKEEKCVLQ